MAILGSLQACSGLKTAAAGYELTEAGRDWLALAGLQPEAPSPRRRFAYACLDWSERRDHLAGQLADQIYQHFSARDWLRRGSGRAVALTATGRRELLPLLAGGTSL